VCIKDDGTVGDTTTFNVEMRVFNIYQHRSLLKAVDTNAIAGCKMLHV
jgi:hypothetical protein